MNISVQTVLINVAKCKLTWVEEMDRSEFFEAEGSVLYNHGKEGCSESKA